MRICQLTVLLFLQLLLTAQSPQLEKITIDDGLSQGMIHDIIQTQDDFLWIATKDGLNRYDGYDFKVFAHNPYNPFSIAGNTVYELFEDSRGLIWIGFQARGIDVYNPKTGKFHHLTSSKTMKWESIFSITEDGNRRIWIGGKDVLARLEVPNDFLQKRKTSEKADIELVIDDLSSLLFSPQNKDDIGVRQLLFSENERLFAFCGSGYLQINWRDSIIQEESIEKISEAHASGLGFMTEEANGRIWIAAPQHICYWKNNELHITPLQMDEGTYIFPLIFQNKLFFFDKNIQQYSINRLLDSELEGGIFFDNTKLDEVHYNRPMLDKSGLIWMGTNGYGLLRYAPNKQKFKRFLNGFSGRSIREDQDGKLWMRTYEQQLFNYTAFDEATGVFSNQKILKGADIHVWDFIKDNEGQKWILGEVSNFGGFFIGKQNAQGVLGERYSLELKNADHASYFKLVKDQKGYIWVILTNNIVRRFDPKAGTFFHFDLTEVSPVFNTETISGLNLYEDHQGNLWFGSNLGLIQCIPKGGDSYDWTFYENDSNDPQSLSFNHVMCALDDVKEPNKYLWVGTKGGGLNRLDKTTGQFEHFTTSDGLPNNVVYGILADSQGDLWMSTNQGLSEFDPIHQTFQNFTSDDGLQSNEFNTNSFFKRSNDHLIFGGVNGYNIFHPDSLQFNLHNPKMVITSLKINNELVEYDTTPDSLKNNVSEAFVLTKPLEQTKSIELAYHQNLIALEYAALDFTDPIHNRYQYQLEGSDKDWIDVGTNRFALYSNLEPGRYTFKVKGTNNEGLWSEEPATLGITIHPPWWKTTWAYASYLAAFLLLLYTLYNFQVNRAKLKTQLLFEQKEAERLAELDKLKTNFYSNITHEFRTPLTLIIEPLRQILPKLKNHNHLLPIKLAISNSQKLLQLVNQLLDMSKLEGKKMELDLRRGDILQTLIPIFRSFVVLAEKKGITLIWNYPNGLPKFYFDKDKLEKIIYNLLSNAIKFTEEGMVEVVIHQASAPSNEKTQNKRLQIAVKDSGVGITPEQIPHVFDRFYQADTSTTRRRGGTGIGLALTKELVELMGGSIAVKSEVGVGTTFTMELPLVEETLVYQKNDVEAGAGSLPPMEIQENNLEIEKNGTFATPPINDSKAIVLLIEDNAELRHFIQQVLIQHYQVIEASNGAEGIRKAKDIIPDLIVSDIMMPQKDGFEVCDALKNEALTSHIPIILLTAKSAIDSKIKGLKTGADAYLTKPFHVEELLVRIEKLIELRNTLRQKYSQIKGTQKKQKTELFSNIDNDFLRKLTLMVEERLADETLTVAALAAASFMSRSQLLRKMKALTNQSPNEFIRNYRLDRAIELLRNKEGNVGEVASLVGFGNEKYFSTRFKERFGMPPSKVEANTEH